MYEVEESVAVCRRLLYLVEMEADQIRHGIQGDLLNSYRELLELETSNIKNVIQEMQNIN